MSPEELTEKEKIKNEAWLTEPKRRRFSLPESAVMLGREETGVPHMSPVLHRKDFGIRTTGEKSEGQKNPDNLAQSR